MKILVRAGLVMLPAFVLLGCGRGEGPQTMEVTATAYTMAEDETKKGNVGLAAWGDQLEPGMKAIAVSRDLIDDGLDHETKVKIEGLEGTYIVRDKMNKRWKKKIDIFMGKDKEKALEWGKKTVTIHWTNPPKGES
jgi:3D (Asp-Asp-Asp) domain-containing protein